MKNLKNKNWLRKVLTVVNTVMITAAVVAIMIPLLQAATPVQKKTYDQLSFAKAQALYHLRINNLFNNKIKLLIDKKGSDKGNCKDEKDITTYCLSQAATEEYFQYRDALLTKAYLTDDTTVGEKDSILKRYVKGDADLLLKQLESDSRFTSNDIALTAAAQTDKIQIIYKELDAAQKTLDQTLAAYNELRAAYPMHLKFQETISNLVKYRDQLKKIRSDVESYPGKFHDATTTQCQ